MPTSIVDPALGVLTFDEGLNWYTGTILSPANGSVPFTISLDAQPSAEFAISRARSLLPALVDSIPDAREFACDQLLSLANDAWLQEGEAALTGAAFVRRLAVGSIGIYAEDEAEFFLRAGDLFGGHTILISWSRARGFYGADIAG